MSLLGLSKLASTVSLGTSKLALILSTEVVLKNKFVRARAGYGPGYNAETLSF